MPGALGGVGVAPYQTFYKDLSASIGNGLVVGAETTFSFTFERPEGTTVSYAVAIRGIRNNDPNGLIGGPYSGQQGTPVTFDASNSTDPDGEALTFSWDFGDGSTGTGAKPQHAYSATGLFSVVVTVSDPRGAVVTRETQVPISPPGAFALARTRTLDGNGHPLGAVAVTQSGPDGSRTFQSDTVSGFTSLGGQPGDHTWSFAREGYLTSFRKTTLTQGSVKVVSFPWLAPLRASRTTLSLLNPTSVKSPAERVTLTVPPEAFEQVVSVALTDLHGQNLPLPLPYGWSPLAAFHLDAPAASAADIAASVKLLQAVPPSRPLVLVHLATATPAWLAESLPTSTGGDTLAVVLRKPGSYAVVIADTLPAGNPALAQAGQPLPAGAAAAVAPEVTAAGVVNPAATVASLDPARVTATATVDFTNGTQPLASGAWFLADVQETYDLRDGQAFKTPDYDATFYAYQTPGDASASTATASFPLRPRILFGPDQLTEANLKLDVLALNQFSGGIVTQDGGQLSLPGLRIGIPAGAVASPSATEIRLISTANLSRFLGEFQPLLAFEINLPRLADGTSLDFSITQKLAPDSHFVLARCVNSGSQSGLQPVLRLRSDSQGVVTSAEPASGPRLPGITGSGQYVVVKINEPQALITGLVRKVGGALLPAAIVRVSAEPWLSFTGGAGTFSTLAKPGERNVIGSDPTDGNSGQATASLANAASVANVEIQTAATGPRVLATTPVANDTKASKVAPIIVEFSEPIQPGSFGANGIRLFDVAANVDVPGSLSLDLSNRKATLLPLNPLNNATDYQIIVSNAILDRQNLPIEGTLTFAFKTAPSDERPAGAQLVIYEPGADAIPPAILDLLVAYDSAEGSSHVVAHGSPGTADPEVPVILVNQNTGETATVLSKPDGSFADFINAAEEDFIEAVFVNANGTRVTVPATRQIFDNGQIGLYKYGGILEAENAEPGTAQILVEPATIEERVKFKVDTVALQRILEALDGTVPEGGQVLGGIVASHENAAGVEGSADVVFAVDPAALQLPAGITKPEDATFLLTSVQEVDGVTVFEVLDTMQYADGKLRTASPPFPGLTFLDAAGKVLSKTLKGGEKSSFASKSLGKSNKILAQLGLPSLQDTVTHQLLLPILMAQGTTSRVVGRVVAQAVDENGEPRGEAQPVGGAVIGVEPPPFTGSGLRPGAVIAQSDATGKFALRVDVGLQGGAFRLAATHPRFPHQVALSFLTVGSLAERFTGAAGDLNSSFLLANVALNKLKFIIPPAPGTVGEDELSPRVRAAHTPVLPLAGLGADAGVALSAAGIDERAVVSLTVRVLEAEAASGQALSQDTEILLTETAVAQPAPGLLEKQFRLQCARAGRVRLELRAADDAGNVTTVEHVVDFGRVPLITGTGDGTLPLRVLSVWPPPGSTGHAAFPELTLRFNKPVPPKLLAPGATDWLTFAQGYFVTALEPGLDRREVRLRFAGPPRGDVAVTVGSPLVDANGEAFDQNPDIDGAQSFAWSFGLAAPDVATLGLQRGGGTALLGATLLALDRKSPNGPGELVVYDVADPTNPKRIAAITVMEDPSDLALLPAYSVVPRPGALPTTRNLVAVIGGGFGDFSEQGNGVGFKNLRLIDVTSPSSPTVFATGNVGFDPTSRIHKLVAVPPFLGYLEASADVTGIHLVDIAAFVLGRNASAQERAFFPINPEFGLDLNGDGDFVDAGEKNSEAERSPAKFFGDFYSFAPIHSAERVVDFSLGNGALLGAISTFPAGGAAMYRNLVTGADPADPEVGAYRFGVREDPKRVTVLTEVAIRVAGEIRILDLALVSLRAAANGQPALAVLDLSNPQRPVRLGDMPLAPTDGIPQTLTRRNDGQLALAVTNGTLLLDPLRLLEKDAQGRSLAVTGRVDGTGGGTRAFVADGSGLVASGGGAGQILFQGPGFDLLTFKEAPIPASAWAVLPTSEQERRLAAALPVRQVRAAGVRFGGTPEAPVPSVPNPLNHYYVLCHVPGGAGGLVPPGTIDLSAASVTSAGKLPGVNATNTLPHLLADPASRRALLNGLPDATTSFPTRLTAHRLSNDPLSAFYNLFLAGPLTTHRALGATEAAALTSQLPRAMLRQDAALYIGLAPQANGVNDGFLNPYRPALQAGTLRAAEGLYLETDRVRNPLIFVHGIMASNLSNGGRTDLWVPLFQGLIGLNADSLLSSTLNTIFDSNVNTTLFNSLQDLVLPPTVPPTRTGANVFPTDILRSVVGFDVQGEFMKFLREDLGYREYVWDYERSNEAALRLDGEPKWSSLETLPELFPFPYDWRKDNAESAARLAKYVELIKISNPDADHVDIIAHSMGGLVSRRFMLDHPGVVEKFISIASPYLGATKAVVTGKTGDLSEFALNLLVPEKISKPISRHMPALHQLMPSQGLFQLGFRPVTETGWDADGDGKTTESYEYATYKLMLDGPVFPALPGTDTANAAPKPIINNNEPFHSYSGLNSPPNSPGKNQDDWSADQSGAQIYHIVAVQQTPQTIGRVHLTPAIVPDPDAQPDLSLGFPPVSFEDSEQLDSDDPLLDPVATLPVKPGNYKLTYSMRTDRVAGDGTVPLLSATRGYGAGPGHDLNAPNAVMMPIMSVSTADKDEDAAGHVPIMHHPKMFDLVERILTRGLEKTELAQVSISGGSVQEGALFSFQAEITPPVLPDGKSVTEPPVVVWETGDGTTITGQSGSHVYQSDGSYTLTCCVYYPNAGLGGVDSAVVQVGNAPPQVTLEVEPTNPLPGQPFFVTANVNDAGKEDTHTFEWQVDGTINSLIPIEAFRIERAFAETGTHSFAVTVKDDNGATATATTSVAISSTPPAPAPVPTPPPAPAPAPTGSNELEEFVDMTITGHKTGLVPARVSEDGTSMISVFGVVREFTSLAVGNGAGSDERIRIIRAPKVNGQADPNACAVSVTAAGRRVSIVLRHVPQTGSEQSFYWEVPTSLGQEVTLSFNWKDLPTLAQINRSGMTSPAATKATTVPIFRGAAATLVATQNRTTQTLDLTSMDRTLDDQDPFVDVDSTTIAIVDNVPDGVSVAPGGVPTSTQLDGAPVILLDQSTVAEATIPSGAPAILALDTNGVPSVHQTLTPPASNRNITPAEVAEIKAGIQSVFIKVALEPLFQQFVLDASPVSGKSKLEHLLILEQGSGASLWKDPTKSVYIPRESDNDYEILLPLFIDPRFGSFNPTQPADRARFAHFAHGPEFMEGDWYFLPPKGRAADGSSLGPLPDRSDTTAFDRYVEATAKWVYTVPLFAKNSGVTTLDGQTEVVIDKGAVFLGDENLFKQPVTPGEIITFALSRTVKNNETLKKLLPDISFFPFRREHFLFGVPSLEKPPPQGDDPIGDAGMGRGLLFLKWTLEGVFLPTFGGTLFGDFNADVVNELQLRNDIHARLAARADTVEPENYEWGAFQEFALLKGSAHLRMDSAPSAASYPHVFADYLSKQDDKIMRKAGKSGIRGVMARLMKSPTVRAAVFALTPTVFDADPSLLSFEHFAAREGIANVVNVGGGVDEAAIQRFLRAKNGEEDVFREIRAQPAGVDGYLNSVFTFLKDGVQQPGANGYTAFLDALEQRGDFHERDRRLRNGIELDYGTQTVTASSPGRAELLGLQGSARSSYNFIVNVQARANTNGFGPFAVELATPGENTISCSNLSIPANQASLTIDKVDGKPIFAVRRQPGVAGPSVQHTFTITGAAGDSRPQNNSAVFESRFLNLAGRFFEPRFAAPQTTRTLFRGFNLDDAGLASLTQQLQNGDVLSAAARNGLTPSTARNLMLNGGLISTGQLSGTNVTDFLQDSINNLVLPGDQLFGFSDEDFAFMAENGNTNEMVAIYHSSDETDWSPCISLTQDWNTAESFALGDRQHQIIVAFDLPQGEGVSVPDGLEYAPTARSTPAGPVFRRISNRDIGEVIYFDHLFFDQARIFSLTKDPVTRVITVTPGRVFQ
jgi:PKD repeat protein/pimeloyl-ACP methyl ester carboxylesterase